jgi:hypothetical protein
MRISVHRDGIEMICAKCDRLVFYLHFPPEVTQQTRNIGLIEMISNIDNSVDRKKSKIR